MVHVEWSVMIVRALEPIKLPSLEFLVRNKRTKRRLVTVIWICIIICMCQALTWHGCDSGWPHVGRSTHNQDGPTHSRDAIQDGPVDMCHWQHRYPTIDHDRDDCVGGVNLIRRIG